MRQMICEWFLLENEDARGGICWGFLFAFCFANQSFQNPVAVLDI